MIEVRKAKVIGIEMWQWLQAEGKGDNVSLLLDNDELRADGFEPLFFRSATPHPDRAGSMRGEAVHSSVTGPRTP